MKKKILFVTHSPRQCGVYEFGKNIFNAIRTSDKLNFIHVICDSLIDLRKEINDHQPEAIIYNYHPSVLPWVCSKITSHLYRNNITDIRILQLGIIHEVTQEIADVATSYRNKILIGKAEKRINSLFDYYIAPDPTLLLKNPLVFKTDRLIKQYNKARPTPVIPTIGSFGFATANKGFESLVIKVQEEFDEAIIRLNIPGAFFGDQSGEKAREIADTCRKMITKPNVNLEVTHDFLEEEELYRFLADNSMNVFLYEDKKGRGISSTVDYALAVQKPIAVSRSPMFRHILKASPSVCVEDNTLKTILNNGFTTLKDISKDWNVENITWEYERIIEVALNKQKYTVKPKRGIKSKLLSKWNQLISAPVPSFTWLKNTEAATTDDLTPDKSINYKPVNLPDNKSLNIILDDEARMIYQPAVTKLFELAPATMSKKIPKANVQQAFVFDTVCRFLGNYDQPNLLCVGSYEDTASMALQKMGYKVDDIDPMLNYFLQEYYTKPSTRKESYDIILSTSVIEHDPDDKSFIECIEGLMSPGGIAVITCDYKNGWKKGDPKPDVDERFYTKDDLQTRLVSYLKQSELIDRPNWESLSEDFNYLGKYQYTFATFVFRKFK